MKHILDAIRTLPAQNSPHLVAIDGRCASGKTTLAKKLGYPTVHMDDFFLPVAMRTEERLARAGENIHHERFLEEILKPLSEGKSAILRRYDCHTDTFLPPVTVECAPVILVEGSYSCHPSLFPYYSLRIFLSVDPDEQLRRIEKRNGVHALPRFRDRFIPMEELYFSTFDIPKKCEIKEINYDF